jgi:hypothetical protein
VSSPPFRLLHLDRVSESVGLRLVAVFELVSGGFSHEIDQLRQLSEPGPEFVTTYIGVEFLSKASDLPDDLHGLEVSVESKALQYVLVDLLYICVGHQHFGHLYG